MHMSGARTKNKELLIFTERCKGCGFCIEFCAQHVLSVSRELNGKGYNPVYLNDSDECTKCNMCGMICPDFAITVVEASQSEH